MDNKPEEETGPMHGPFRKAPHYYVGETVGRHTVNYPDVERNPNGTIAGIRDKAARRQIRGLMMRSFSRIDSRIRKGRQLGQKMLDYAEGVIEEKKLSKKGLRRRAKKLLAKALSLHKPVEQVDSRALRTAFRKRKREVAKERGIHVRELEASVVKQLADKMYGSGDDE